MAAWMISKEPSEIFQPIIIAELEIIVSSSNFFVVGLTQGPDREGLPLVGKNLLGLEVGPRHVALKNFDMGDQAIPAFALTIGIGEDDGVGDACLLRRGTLGIGEIAFAIGFQSSSAFSRFVGCSPKRFAALTRLNEGLAEISGAA